MIIGFPTFRGKGQTQETAGAREEEKFRVSSKSKILLSENCKRLKALNNA